MELSVVICTRNRSAELRKALDAACGELDAFSGCELIVVDNASADDTEQVVREFGDGRCFVRYCMCDRTGLSHARNEGVRQAEGELVAFLDDDALAGAGWPAAVVSVFDDPNVHAMGGRTILQWREERPSWFPVEFECYLAPYDRGTARLIVTGGPYPMGANMAFRRRVFEELGGFDTRLGYCGSAKVGWEDIEMFDRVDRWGGRIVYEPRALVHHLVGPEKTTRRYLRRRLFAEGYGHVFYTYISSHPSKPQIRKDLRLAVRDAAEAAAFHTRWLVRHGRLEYKYKMDTLRRMGRLCALARWWRQAALYSEREWAGLAESCRVYRPPIASPVE